MSRTVAALLSIAIGIGFMLLVLLAWPLIALHNAIPLQLVQAGLSGPAWYGVLTLQDFAINLLLAAPAAWLLLRLGRTRLRFHCTLATLTFATAVTFAAGLPVFAASGFIAAGWLLMLAALPVATWLLSLSGRGGGRIPSGPLHRPRTG
ncbi:hypothetical protein [Stenotrophomonas mori]|uniref:Uncharacterized protein n=1 Tax=Stenotrophomonas mori TaxID=2871096 RepID=A0ABT0SFZ0_9GAMM|nr:hypothetical protein [Stenotrophomonas mori]MCL7713983.1 hypothetical protein [Stenotrophomonas mori]